jgi:hypothetical protein
VVRSVCGGMLMAFVSLVWASTSFRDPEGLSRQRTKLSAFGCDGVERGLRRFSPTGATLAAAALGSRCAETTQPGYGGRLNRS